MSIISRNDYIQVYGVTQNVTPYRYDSLPFANAVPMGSVIFDFAAQKLKVSDGCNWQDIESRVSIGLSESTLKVIAWAEQKMKSEAEAQSLELQHPGLKQAREQYEFMLNLVRPADFTAEKS